MMIKFTNHLLCCSFSQLDCNYLRAETFFFPTYFILDGLCMQSFKDLLIEAVTLQKPGTEDFEDQRHRIIFMRNFGSGKSPALTWDGLPPECGAWVLCCWSTQETKTSTQEQNHLSEEMSNNSKYNTHTLHRCSSSHTSAISAVKNLNSSTSLFIQYLVPLT